MKMKITEEEFDNVNTLLLKAKKEMQKTDNYDFKAYNDYVKELCEKYNVAYTNLVYIAVTGYIIN